MGTDEAAHAPDLTIDRPTDAVRVIRVTGDVTAETESIAEAYEQAAPGAHVVALDFTQLEYMNSGGIGLLVTLLVRARRHKVSLVAFGLTEHYRQIFQLTRLDEVITVHDDEADLLAAARG